MSTAVAMAGINEIIGEQILHSRWSLQGRRAGVFVVSSWTRVFAFWSGQARKGMDERQGVEDEMSQLLQLQKPTLRRPLNRESHSGR